MQPSRGVVETGEAGLLTDSTRSMNRPPPLTADYSSFTLPRDETMLPRYIIDPL